MSTLDNPNLIDPSTVPYAKKAFNQGPVAALILIAIGLVFNLTGLVEPGKNDAMAWIVNIVNIGVIGYFIYTAATKHRDEDLGGYISFGRAFGVGAIVILAVAVITMVWSYIYFAYIDPGVFETIKQGAMEQMMNQQGMSEEDAEQALNTMSFMWKPGVMSLMTGVSIGFFGLIVALIVSAVVKKDNPAFA